MSTKKKIAVIFASSIYNQKGLFNAVHNRIVYLKKIADYDIDVYLLSSYKGKLISLFLGLKSVNRIDTYEKDGIIYNILWRKNSILDYFFYHKLHKKEPIHALYNKRISTKFKDYDLLDIHSGAGEIALQANMRYNIPFVITWHGSDIHTVPFNGRSHFKMTHMLLKKATYNFFVSRGLVDSAFKVCQHFDYEILYNGANSSFYQYDERKRKCLQNKYNVEKSKVVSFLGNIIHVKNPLVLPLIFNAVRKKYNADVTFWIIGDGEYRKSLEKKFDDLQINCVFWGNQPREIIPDFLQCIDVVVLPSLQEGFGMVLVEAIKCGANAVASRVGGTAEVLGVNDTFVLDENFIDKISSRIVYYLNNRIRQPLDGRFSWENTAQIENNCIQNILNKKDNKG